MIDFQYYNTNYFFTTCRNLSYSYFSLNFAIHFLSNETNDQRLIYYKVFGLACRLFFAG
jgi:hypothetical protein